MLPRRTARCWSMSSGSSRARRCRSSSGRSCGRTRRSAGPRRGRRARPDRLRRRVDSRRSSRRSAPTGGSSCSSRSRPTRPELPERTAALERCARPPRRRAVAAFTSTDRAADLARLAAEQDAELLVVDTLPDGAARGGAVRRRARAARRAPSTPEGPVLVPFGGGRRGVGRARARRLARARARRCRCSCSASRPAAGRRDASRMLASASLALQRFTGIVAEPVIVAPGVDGILAEQGAVIVASLPDGELDATRSALVERARGARAARARRPPSRRPRPGADADPLQLVACGPLGAALHADRPALPFFAPRCCHHSYA